MVSLNSGPISSCGALKWNSLIFPDTFNRVLGVGKGCGRAVRFLEVKARKCSGVVRMCSLGWDCGESKDLETEILEFMKTSEKPGMFPTKEDLIRSGRFDLVQRIVNQGGWLSMGWDLDQHVHLRTHDHETQSGIQGILTGLEKQRNLSLGISLREKGESNATISPIILSATTSGEDAQNSYQDTKSSETWRTWSMRRAGFTDEDFQAAEISANKDTTNEDLGSTMNGKDINPTHVKTRLQHLHSQLSSVLHSLRSHPDQGLTSKDSEIDSGNLENVYDDWEFKENEIIHAQNKLRSTRAKLAVLEGKMAMAIIDAQRILREKQRKIDHASRALRLLRTTSIVWPNSASEVLLTGSFDGWSTRRKMKKAENGVFSVSLKLYPGKYEVKFIVDGQWRVDPLRPIVTCNGYENNLLIIS